MLRTSKPYVENQSAGIIAKKIKLCKLVTL